MKISSKTSAPGDVWITNVGGRKAYVFSVALHEHAELEMLAVAGTSFSEIATKLSISKAAVAQRMSRMYKHHRVSGRAELVAHLLSEPCCQHHDHENH
jgi:DNA-binding CsgD family transcriptional regulator